MGIHLKASKSNTRPPGIMIWDSLLIDLEKYDMEFAISRMDFCVYLFSGYIQPHLVFFFGHQQVQKVLCDFDRDKKNE